MRRIVPLVLGFAISGCDGFEQALGVDPEDGGRIDVDVEVKDGVPEISWDHGVVAHSVSVVKCFGECTCSNNGHYLGGRREEDMWVVSGPGDSRGTIESPITYGDEAVPGDTADFSAEPLDPGETYGVEVEWYRNDADGKGLRLACTEFVME